MTDATHNSSARDAHVQVLTAEVRTLVVGSRQVTMSVYNQLDEVPSRDVIPFGRVNPKDANERRIYVVGRHATDGTLVRSDAYRDPMSLTETHWDAIKERLANTTRQDLADVAEQWASLPLIVLAGLR